MTLRNTTIIVCDAKMITHALDSLIAVIFTNKIALEVKRQSSIYSLFK